MQMGWRLAPRRPFPLQTGGGILLNAFDGLFRHSGAELSVADGDAVTEKEIVQGCKQGSREAQRELYLRTCDRVYCLLLRMTGNPDDASELTQDTFLRVFRKVQSFEGNASISTWVYQIALNEGRQFLRRRKGREEAVSALARPTEANPEIERETARLDIKEALAKLPEAERTLIVLRHLQELSYDEMAGILGKPAGTIASGLNRARQMLRDRLDSRSRQPCRRNEIS